MSHFKAGRNDIEFRLFYHHSSFF